jgi:hypothetical protein
VKDDRPPDNISYGATNLVKPGLQSRSASSASRGFPPTPPPESEPKATQPPPLDRAASVRNGFKPPLPRLQTERGPSRFERSDSSGTPSRAYSQRRDPDARSRERGSQDLYDMYTTQSRSNSRYNGPEDGSDYGDQYDPGDFEIVSGPRRQASNLSRASSRRPDINKIRVKVHADDVRYIMVGTAIQFPDLVDSIRQKFNIRRKFKIMIRDDDDMVTLVDQDDLDMQLTAAISQARKQRLETGKMEVRLCMHVLVLASTNLEP